MSSYSPYTWLARLGQGLNKFTDQLTGQVLQLNSTPDSVSQEGTPFSVDRMNAIEQGLATHTHDASEIPTGNWPLNRVSGVLQPENGGTGANSISALFNALLTQGASRVVSGTYSGNGQYGQGTPNSLSFPFPPKFLMIAEPQGYSVIVINNSQYALYSGVGAWYLFATWSGNSVSWYSPDGERDQMNSSGKTYTYYAFG